MGTAEKSPRTEFVHYTSQGNLEGLRQGDWKILVKQPRRRNNQNQNRQQQKPTIMLFNLADDLGEQNNLASEKPDVVAKLRARMEELDAEVTQNARAPWKKEG